MFADGASSGNPGPGGWGSIVCIYPNQIIELGGSESFTTNNRMELTAVIRALDFTRQWDMPIEIYTDSTYVIRGITQWIWGWKKKDWINSEGKPVANADLWKILSSLVVRRTIDWKYVRGHSGIPGNERVDQIAVDFSKGTRPYLFEGKLSDYRVDLSDIPQNCLLPESRSRESSPKKPFSYLSLVGGVPMRHAAWAECEKRVKGTSGAKFKKAMTHNEEKEILNSWGFDIKDVMESERNRK